MWHLLTLGFRLMRRIIVARSFSSLGAIVAPLFFLLSSCAPLPAGPTFRDVPILVAAEIDDVSAVKSLLDGGGEINAKDQNGWTALMIAANVGNADVVRLLIDRRTDVNAVDFNRETAMMHAAATGQVEIVRLLIANGADVNAKANFNRTALHFAAERKFINDRQLVAAMEKRPVIKSKPGNHFDTLNALLDAGADVDSALGDGTTLWHGLWGLRPMGPTSCVSCWSTVPMSTSGPKAARPLLLLL